MLIIYRLIFKKMMAMVSLLNYLKSMGFTVRDIVAVSLV